MSFDEILSKLTDLLRRDTRVSYRAIKRHFNVDDAFLEDLRAELVDAKRLAIDEGGKVLVWRASVPGGREEQSSPTGRNYTPGHLWRPLQRPSVRVGERKQVTVLFCDVVDSARLAQRLDAEAMHTVMDRVLSLAARCVDEEGGFVNQYLGDGIMALFGAPFALEDHAVRCVTAALKIHEAIEREDGNLMREHGAQIRFRIGVNTGEVVVGRIGHNRRMDYTATGNITHLAERLQEAAEPGTTLIGESTQRLVDGYAVAQGPDRITVKGQHEPVSAYRLIKLLPHRSRFQVLAERGLTPLVGRTDELALLGKRYELACKGRGQAVGIVGGAGVGKSRIVHEFVRVRSGDDVACLVGQCTAPSKSTPYVPVIEILRSMFHIDEGAGPEAVREKVRRGLTDLDSNLGVAEPLLCQLLTPAELDDPVLKGLNPSETRKRLLEALLAIMSAAVRQRPMILVVEDLHWMDASSASCLNGLVQNLERLPLLLLTTHRPDPPEEHPEQQGYTPPWSDSAHYTQIPIAELTAAETDRMLSEILQMGAAPGARQQEVPPRLRKQVHAKVGGNPLFVEEIMRSLLGRDLAAPVADGSASALDLAIDIDIPPTVKDVVRARIDELGEASKRTLQAAAAVGPVFSAQILAVLPDLRGDTEHALEVVTKLGLIQKHRSHPDLEYAFKHTVVQDVAYETLLTSSRRQLHGEIGRAFERVWEGRIEEQLPVLAYHFSQSDDYAKGLAYSMQAGERAERLYARMEATVHYEKALELARALPDSKDSEQAQVDAIVKLAAVAHEPAHRDRDRQSLERAQAMATGLGDKIRAARVLHRRGRLHYEVGEFAEALQCAEQCMAIADELRDDSLLASAVNLEGRARWQHGDYGRAVQLLVRSANQMRRLGEVGEEATAAGFAGWTFAFLGDFKAALEYTARGLRLAVELGNPFAEAAARFYRGAAFDQQGLWSEAIAEYAEARRIAGEAGDRFREYLIKCQEGRAHAMTGDLELGAATLNQAIELAEELRTPFVLAWPKAYLAHCLNEQANIQAGRALAEEALRLAQKAGDKYAQFMAYRELARSFTMQRAPDYKGAEEALRQSIRLQHEMGIRPELGRTYLQYADMCRRQGQTGQAAAYVNVAMDLFRQLGMSWDLERAKKLLAAVT